jgi:hypothetical protein
MIWREMLGALVAEPVVAFGWMVDGRMLYLPEPSLQGVGLLQQLSRTLDVFLLGLLVFLQDLLEDAHPNWLLLPLLLHLSGAQCLLV